MEGTEGRKEGGREEGRNKGKRREGVTERCISSSGKFNSIKRNQIIHIIAVKYSNLVWANYCIFLFMKCQPILYASLFFSFCLHIYTKEENICSSDFNHLEETEKLGYLNRADKLSVATSYLFSKGMRRLLNHQMPDSNFYQNSKGKL